MSFKKCLIVLKQAQRDLLLGSFTRALSNITTSENSNIRNNVLFSDSSDVVISSSSLTEYMFNKMEPFQNYIAIECAISGKTYTYGELRTKSMKLSKFLRRKLNLKRGEVVGIVLTNRPECAVAVLGILEAGLTLTSLNPLYTIAEMANHLSALSAKAVITQCSSYPTVQSAVSSISAGQMPIILVKDKQSESVFRGTVDFEEVTNTTFDGPEIVPAKSEDVAFLPFSSGTTGTPKGIELTHRNLVAIPCQQCHPDLDFSSPPTAAHQDAVAAVLPFYHIFGFGTILLTHLVRGVKLITQPKFMPDKYVEMIKNYKTSFLFATPPLLLFLISNNEVKPEYLDSLQYISCGAAPLGELDELRFEEKFGKHLKICQGLGMTEGCLIATAATKTLKTTTSGSVGKPIPNTTAKVIKIGDREGTPLGPNELGELLVKGPQVMKGYRNAPEETSHAFLNGWLRTGDIVYYNENGCLFIKDRLKEVIKVKGYQVAPAELEELIRNYPAVADAGVIGVPHPVFGEVPRAYVVQKENSILDPKEVEEYINKNVIKYKRVLGGIEIIDSIPKTVSGKILRRELKQRFMSSHG